jgi:sulfite oxidase
LEDLKTKFPKHSITATIQCGGNRRADMNKFR